MNATPRTRITLIAAALACFAGDSGAGCGCDGCDGCSDDSGFWESEEEARYAKVVETHKPFIALPASPGVRTAQEVDRVKTGETESTLFSKRYRVQKTVGFCTQYPDSCSPVLIKEVGVEKGKWPRWYVDKIKGADMIATWDCNSWKRGTNPVVKPGQRIKICGWR